MFIGKSMQEVELKVIEALIARGCHYNGETKTIRSYVLDVNAYLKLTPSDKDVPTKIAANSSSTATPKNVQNLLVRRLMKS